LNGAGLGFDQNDADNSHVVAVAEQYLHHVKVFSVSHSAPHSK